MRDWLISFCCAFAIVASVLLCVNAFFLAWKS